MKKLRPNSGVFACDFVGGTAHYIGSLDHESSDAESFATWGADYLKVFKNPPSPIIPELCLTILNFSMIIVTQVSPFSHPR